MARVMNCFWLVNPVAFTDHALPSATEDKRSDRIGNTNVN
ncbi:hypothetical protein SEHO0A_00479 [Salmonella enterica subsp. houtenae str. ATCC BAA-1581]|nr:hypothetical protein SEHO0A_00479 [Salmonella enterica subsp. houtenae str. ATCC BAA-1581]